MGDVALPEAGADADVLLPDIALVEPAIAVSLVALLVVGVEGVVVVAIVEDDVLVVGDSAGLSLAQA